MRAANGKAFQRKKNPWKKEQCAKKLDFFRVDLPRDLRLWRKQIEQGQLAPPGGRSELLNDSTYHHSWAPPITVLGVRGLPSFCGGGGGVDGGGNAALRQGVEWEEI